MMNPWASEHYDIAQERKLGLLYVLTLCLVTLPWW